MEMPIGRAWMLQKGNIVIPMDNITTHLVYIGCCNLPRGFKIMQMHCGTYTKHSPSGKTGVQANGPLILYLTNIGS